ncbi:hypothetical protein B0H13DRAFT_2367310 [Mycena leptocephala]|nr:hypothetical protein B0H13DRAFT_2367310 [Mycena leptocephala]
MPAIDLQFYPTAPSRLLMHRLRTMPPFLVLLRIFTERTPASIDGVLVAITARSGTSRLFLCFLACMETHVWERPINVVVLSSLWMASPLLPLLGPRTSCSVRNVTTWGDRFLTVVTQACVSETQALVFGDLKYLLELHDQVIVPMFNGPVPLFESLSIGMQKRLLTSFAGSSTALERLLHDARFHGASSSILLLIAQLQREL